MLIKYRLKLKLFLSYTNTRAANVTQAFTYPKEVGIPIGGHSYYPMVALEIHYNNEKKKSGVLKPFRLETSSLLF